MTKLKLMKMANKFYPDGDLGEYFDPKTGDFFDNPKGGDTLARSIVSNLDGIYDGKLTEVQMTREAERIMETLLEDIHAVIAGLQWLDDEWKGRKPNEN